MQLYGSLSARLFGNKRARLDLAPANALTVQEFFTLHSDLTPFLYGQVTRVVVLVDLVLD